MLEVLPLLHQVNLLKDKETALRFSKTPEVAEAASSRHAERLLKAAREDSRYELYFRLEGLGANVVEVCFTLYEPDLYKPDNHYSPIDMLSKRKEALHRLSKIAASSYIQDTFEFWEEIYREYPELVESLREDIVSMLWKGMRLLSDGVVFGEVLRRIRLLYEKATTIKAEKLFTLSHPIYHFIFVDGDGIKYFLRSRGTPVDVAELFIDYYTSINFLKQFDEGCNRPVCPFAIKPFKRSDGTWVDQHPQPEFRNCGTVENYEPCKHFRQIQIRNRLVKLITARSERPSTESKNIEYMLPFPLMKWKNFNMWRLYI